VTAAHFLRRPGQGKRERKMKSSKLLAITGLVSVFAIAYPQFGFAAIEGQTEAQAAEAAAARTLADVMEDILVVVKALAPQLPSPATNADSVEKTNKLRALTLEALPFLPEKVEKMPEDSAKKIEFLEYQKLIATLYATLSSLQVDLLKNNNAAALETFKQVKALQKQGHDRFRSAP
jgi:hypothetical protein